jgi:hypothetical protein
MADNPLCLEQYLEKVNVDSVTDLACYRSTKKRDIVSHYDSPAFFLIDLKSPFGGITGNTPRFITLLKAGSDPKGYLRRWVKIGEVWQFCTY